jgi:competence protein ComEC
MPRAGWLALGAVVAALAAAEGWLPAGAAGLGMAVVAVAAVAAAVVLRRPRAVALSLGVATVLLRIAVPAAITGPPPDPGPPPAEERAWIAEVLTAGSPREGIARGTLRLRPDPADLRWTAPLPDGWRVYAWLPRYPALAPGDRFPVTGAVQPPPTDGSGFAEYLAGQSLTGTLRVVRVDEVRHGAAALAQLETGRRAAADLVSLALSEPEGGLATGILIGIKERVSAEVADAFATTGLSHVVAISGWNIALVGGVVGGLLAAAGMGRRGRSISVVLAIAAYTLLSGASASVVRAALMGGVAIAARASGRPGTASMALGMAVWLLVLAEPAMAADIGFQLSVTATAGLLAWGDRATGWMRGLGGGRCPGWLAETLGVSLAAQLATLPLVLFHFGRLSLISPLANLLVAPLVAPAMVVSLLGLLGGVAMAAGVPALLLAPIALAGRLVLGGMIGIAHVLAGVPLASVTLPAPWDLAAAAGAAGLVALAVRRGTGRRGRDVSRPPDAPPPLPRPRTEPAGTAHPGDAAGPRATAGSRATPGSGARPRPAPALVVGVGAAALVFAGAAAVVGRSEPRLTVSVLDVGQGDAILVQGPGGTRMLVDGGPDPDRLLTVLDERLPPWDRRIDLVVLTHPHEDHVAGLALLMERYRVGRIAENGMLGAGPGDAAFRERLRTEGRLTARLAAGDQLRLDGVPVLAWWPERGTVPARAPDDGRAINDTSVVLDLRHGTRRFLLMGDVEDDVDPRLLAAGIGESGRADLLKVAHHGSRTASTQAFLAAIRPRVAVASAGTGNRYGHPAPSTLERLEAAGARVLRTDLDGTVTVSTDGRDLRVERSGGRAVAVGTLRELALPDPRRSVAWLPLPCRIPGPATPAAGSPTTARLSTAGDPSARPVTDPGPWLRPGRDPAPIAAAIPCYDRPRDDPHPVRSGRHPARPRRARHPAHPHAGGRGGRRVPRGARGSPRRGRGSCAGGERGAAPRPGQGPPRGSSAAAPGARPCRRRVAHRARAPGARAGRGEPPGDAPRDPRGGALAGAIDAGGAHRGLRRQARCPAPRPHRRALPALVREAPPVQGWSGPRARPRGDPGARRVRGRGCGPRGRAPPALGGRRLHGRRCRSDRRGRRPRSPPMSPTARTLTEDTRGTAPIAWFWGEDAWSIDRAVKDFGKRLAAESGDVLDTWRAPGEDDADGAETGGAAKKRVRVLEEIAARIGTATLFGGGTLVIVRQPGWIARESAGKARLAALIRDVAPGNALCFAELAGQDGKVPAATDELRAAVADAGGTVEGFPAIGRDRMQGWLERRAGELGIRLGPGAAQLLAERVGANVREGDVDRRRQTELANGELEKLALYRPDGTVSREDVADLVAEAVPGSTWAFLDAVAARQPAPASRLAERLLADGTAMPVLTTQLHRRLRELLIVRDHLDAGTRPPDLVKALKMQPFRAQKLAEQAAAWTMPELEAALAGLVDLDLRSKGISTDGSTVQMSDERDALAIATFIAVHTTSRARR